MSSNAQTDTKISKQKLIDELLNNIQKEINKVVICKQCKRKFANQSHLNRHINLSLIHLEKNNK